MTYENVENGFSKNCRKLKLLAYSKMPMVKISLRQKWQKFFRHILEPILEHSKSKID